MRQRKWLELLKNYNHFILYHSGDANIVVNALSKKSFGSLVALRVRKPYMLFELNRLLV